jgi:hypothetical protein
MKPGCPFLSGIISLNELAWAVQEIDAAQCHCERRSLRATSERPEPSKGMKTIQEAHLLEVGRRIADANWPSRRE